jgi:hypothetical protein
MNGRSYPVVLHGAEVMINSLLESAFMIEATNNYLELQLRLGGGALCIEITS